MSDSIPKIYQQNQQIPENQLETLLDDSEASMTDESLKNRSIHDRGFYNSDEEDDLLSEPEPEKDDHEKRILWCSTKGELEEFKILFKKLSDDKGIDDAIKIMDEDKYTIMHKAASNGQVNVLKYLISEESKLSKDNLKFLLQARTDSGWTPLHCACHWNFVECVYLLARNEHCDILAKSDGNLTPAHVLTNLKKPRETLVELLMAHCDESYKQVENNNK